MIERHGVRDEGARGKEMFIRNLCCEALGEVYLGISGSEMRTLITFYLSAVPPVLAPATTAASVFPTLCF